jgi:hypothetical protein
MKPTHSILDPAFRYVPAAESDIRKTFDRIKWQMARAGKQPRRINVGTLVVGRVDFAKPLRKVAG